MNSRERILAAIDHRPLDRIPCDIWATPEVWRGLKDRFGTEDTLAIKRRLGIDGIEQVSAPYTGSDRDLPDGTKTGIWGARYRRTALPTGGTYDEQVHYPLKDVADVRALVCARGASCVQVAFRLVFPGLRRGDLVLGLWFVVAIHVQAT